MRDSATKAPAAKQRAPPSPWPPSARGHILSFKQNKQRGTCLEVLPPRAYYPDRRVVTSAKLVLRRTWRVHSIDRSHQGRNYQITLLPNPLTRPKFRGLLSGTTIRVPLIVY